MKRHIAGIAVLLALAAPILRADIPAAVRARAVKVIESLEQAEREQARPASHAPRSVEVSEADLNAWIALRIGSEPDKHLQSCEIRLFPGDRFEGKIVLDLSGTPATLLLPSETELFFSATGESRDGKIRIELAELFLGTQRIAPAVLDKVIAFVSSLEGTPPASLNDWYALPYGIRRLESRRGVLVCHY
jgi:hypothetical protein